jgi:sigma-E factor negative regulatory protein RseC
MIESKETGEVLEILAGGTARVLLRRRKWCDHCASKRFCNPPSEEDKQFSIEVDNTIGAHQGDYVEIGLERGALFIASIWAYLVPAVLFIVGLAIGFLGLSRVITFVARELVGLFMAVVFLVVSLVLLRIVNNWLGKKRAFHPHITAICSNNSHSD